MAEGRTEVDSYSKLADSVQLLSLPYPEQRNRFPKFVDVPFEVIDTFESAFLTLPSLVEANALSLQCIADLIRLHNYINFTASAPHLKDLEEEQFEFAAEWQKMRELAGETVKGFSRK